MADFNSSLPVRTQNNGDVVVNISDGTTETQKLAVDSSGRITVKLDDGNGNAITSQANGAQRALDVGIDVAGVQVDPRQIRTLTSADVVTVDQGTTPWADNITQIGGSALALGQTTMSASLPVAIASNQSAINVLNTANGSTAGGTAGTQSLQAGGVYESTAPTLTNGQQAALQLDSSGNLKVNLETPIPAGSNLIGATNLYVGGTAASITNPVPVTVTTTSPGTPIQSYQTSASLAAGSNVTLTYTVPATHTFSLERIWVSSEARISAQIQYGASTSTPTYYMAFNSSANPNIDLTIVAPPTLVAAQVVNVIITNNDVQASNVYATIEGNQIS